METLLKQLVKDALFEALTEYFGETEEATTYGGKDGNSNAQENSGGTPKPNKPKPDVGVGTFSLR